MKTLAEKAQEFRASSYSPYSRFAVGAAVELRDGRIFGGVNVENVSYGLTVCAERNAIAAAVLAGMRPGDLASVAVAADAPELTPPCGACRQVLQEFGTAETRVMLHNVRDGKEQLMKLGDLLPQAFVPSALPT